ncbi:MAG TPA: hypothetical protein PLV42_07545 [bacterium]|nr:hypothetical protein [bacterium]
MIEVHTVTTDRKGLKDFLDLPYRLYRDDMNWIPPLRFERKMFFNQKKNPFFEHGEADYFVCYKDGVPAGRITAHIDRNYDSYHKTKHGFFGFFEAENDPAVSSALIKTAEEWVAKRGYDRIIGPMNFTTNHDSPGFSVFGADTPPYLMNPHTMPYYPALFRAAGYLDEQLLNSWALTEPKDLPQEFHDRDEKLCAKYGDRLVVRHIDLKNLRQDVDTILKIFNEAWCDNWGYVPMTEREITAMADELKLIVDIRLTYMVFLDGEPASFMVSMPDINQILVKNRNGSIFSRHFFNLLFNRKRHINQFRVMLLGSLKKYRLLGLDALMYHRLLHDGLNAGMREVEMSWILDTNRPMNNAAAHMGAHLLQQYLILAKPLEPTT